MRILRFGPPTARLDTVGIPKWVETQTGRWYAVDLAMGERGVEIRPDGLLRIGLVVYKFDPIAPESVQVEVKAIMASLAEGKQVSESPKTPLKAWPEGLRFDA